MRNIIDYIEEPRFKSLMLDLSMSNGDEVVNEIIRKYNDVNGNMSDAEKELYGSNVAADIDRVLKIIDEDLHS